MGEVVNVLVAFAVIVFVFKWATSGMCEIPLQMNNREMSSGIRQGLHSRRPVSGCCPRIPTEKYHAGTGLYGRALIQVYSHVGLII